MKRERQIEELAKLDGFDAFIHPTGSGVWYHTEGSVYKLVPPYLRSHDALQPIINGLFDLAQQAYDYHDIIIELCSDDCLYVYTATCKKKAEAILRAVGKWEEE